MECLIPNQVFCTIIFSNVKKKYLKCLINSNTWGKNIFENNGIPIGLIYLSIYSGVARIMQWKRGF